jgi:hypothetical protein
MKAIAATCAALTLSASMSVAEGTGAQGYFTIYNDTAGNVLVSFYTNDGSGWSSNRLTVDALSPGENAEAQFSADTGNCDQHFSAGWLGGDGTEVIDDPISIDICDASNVYLGDNEIYYD